MDSLKLQWNLYFPRLFSPQRPTQGGFLRNENKILSLLYHHLQQAVSISRKGKALSRAYDRTSTRLGILKSIKQLQNVQMDLL